MSHNSEEELIARLGAYVPYLKELIKSLRTDSPLYPKMVQLQNMMSDTGNRYKYEALLMFEPIIFMLRMMYGNLNHETPIPGSQNESNFISPKVIPFSPVLPIPVEAIQNETLTIRRPEPGTWEPPDDRVERYLSEIRCPYSKSAESLCKSKRFQSIVPALDTSKPPRSLSDLELLKSYPLNSVSEDEKRQAENKRPKEDVNKGSNIDKSYKQRGLDAVKKETEEDTTFASFLKKIDDHQLIYKNLGTKPKELKYNNKISEMIKYSTKGEVEKEVFTKLADKYNPKPRKSTVKKSEESPFTPNVYLPKRDLRPTSVAKPSYKPQFNYLPLHRINQRSNEFPKMIPNHSINDQNNNQNRVLNTKNTDLNKEFRKDNFDNTLRPNHSYNNAQTFNKFNSNNNYENQRYHHNFNEGQPRYPHNFNSRIPRYGPGPRLSHNMHNVPHNPYNRRNAYNNFSANSKIRRHRPIHFFNKFQQNFQFPSPSYSNQNFPNETPKTFNLFDVSNEYDLSAMPPIHYEPNDRQDDNWAIDLKQVDKKDNLLNEVEEQNEDVVSDENIEYEEDLEYVSRNSKNYFLDKAVNKCELCDFKGKQIIHHYIVAHPRYEISFS